MAVTPDDFVPGQVLSDGTKLPLSESTPLNRRQEAFVAEYLIDLNGAQAAIRAGYSPNSAANIASDLLGRPHIAAAVQRAKAQRASRVNVSSESVLHEMSLLANSRLDHYVIDDEGQVKLAEGAPDGAMAAVQSIKKKTRVLKDGTREYDVELKLWDKPSPLKLMGRHVGLFPDRVEHTGAGGGPIETVAKVERVIVDDPK